MVSQPNTAGNTIKLLRRFSGRVNAEVSNVDPDLSRYKAGVLWRGQFRRPIGVGCIKVRHSIRMSVSSDLIRTGAVYDSVADPALLLQCSD